MAHTYRAYKAHIWDIFHTQHTHMDTFTHSTHVESISHTAHTHGKHFTHCTHIWTHSHTAHGHGHIHTEHTYTEHISHTVHMQYTCSTHTLSILRVYYINHIPTYLHTSNIGHLAHSKCWHMPMTQLAHSNGTHTTLLEILTRFHKCRLLTLLRQLFTFCTHLNRLRVCIAHLQ